MALALHRNTDTGELLELDENWTTRFPKDPYTLVGTEDLAKLEAERRQADAAALGAQPYAQPEDVPEAAPAAPAKREAANTPTPSPDTRDERRF
jgi:hypothetical protein